MAFVKLASRAQLPSGAFLSVEHDGEPIALFNLDGTVYATRDECTHDGGTLSGGWLEGGCVVCPRHGAKFDVATGEARAMPAYVGIATYPVRVEGDEIYVDVDG